MAERQRRSLVRSSVDRVIECHSNAALSTSTIEDDHPARLDNLLPSMLLAHQWSVTANSGRARDAWGGRREQGLKLDLW